jgi:hypothetical protein
MVRGELYLVGEYPPVKVITNTDNDDDKKYDYRKNKFRSHQNFSPPSDALGSLQDGI